MADSISHTSTESVNNAPLCACGCGHRTLIITHADARRGRVKGEYNRFLPQHHLRVRQPKYRPISELFWRHVEMRKDDECWEWTAYRNAANYGIFAIKKKTHLASRVAYALTYGEPQRGLVVRHKCNNPPCCNPAHLVIGTYTDNVLDIIKARGKHHRAVLTAEQVRDVRGMHNDGIRPADIARNLGISRNTIYNVVWGKHYRHVE